MRINSRVRARSVASDTDTTLLAPPPMAALAHAGVSTALTPSVSHGRADGTGGFAGAGSADAVVCATGSFLAGSIAFGA